MAAFLEVWTVEGRQLLPLEEGRVTVGREADNDLAVVDDPTLSRLHAVIELLGSGWCVRDLASASGTFVNGERIWAERPLRPGDEIRGLGERRRVRLANEAVRRGAVSLADLRG